VGSSATAHKMLRPDGFGAMFLALSSNASGEVHRHLQRHKNPLAKFRFSLIFIYIFVFLI
jgi:hypothetical protein